MSSARSGSPQPSPCVDLSRGSPSLQWGLFRKSTGPHPGNPVHRIALWKFTVSKDKLIISTPQLVIKSFVRAGTEASKVLWKTLPARKPSSILPRGHTPSKGRAVRPGTKQMGNPRNVVGWAHGRILNILRVPPPPPPPLPTRGGGVLPYNNHIYAQFQTKVTKSVPYFRLEMFENDTLRGGTYLYGLYMGVPPPPPPPPPPQDDVTKGNSKSPSNVTQPTLSRSILPNGEIFARELPMERMWHQKCCKCFVIIMLFVYLKLKQWPSPDFKSLEPPHYSTPKFRWGSSALRPCSHLVPEH